jgi:hypothetical protein
MSTLSPQTTPTRPPLRQLPLPLPDDGPPHSPPLPTLGHLPAHRVWKTLSRAQQQHLRQTWLRVLREVVHEQR